MPPSFMSFTLPEAIVVAQGTDFRSRPGIDCNPQPGVVEMAEPQIRFEDGAGYERMMGVWTRLAGRIFLDWLAPAPHLKWLDVGCGNGAFTQLLIQRCAPVAIEVIDPSEAQLAFARQRPSSNVATFRQGGA